MATLDDIIRMSADLSLQQEAYAQEVAAARTSQGTLGKKIAENQRQAAALTESVNLKRGLGELQAIQLARQGASAMGTNAADITEIITATSSQLRADLMAYQAAETKVQEIEEGSNLLSNPGGWLKDLLIGDEARATRDATLRRHQNTSAMLSNMYALTDANTRTQLSLAETMDADTIKKAAEADRLAAEAIAADAEIKALSYNIDGINALRELGPQEFARESALYNMAVSDARFEASYAQQKAQLEIQERNLARQEGQDAAYQFTADNINTALRAQGLEEFPVSVVREFYGTKTPEGDLMMELNTLGQMSKNAGSAIIGTSPASAYSLLKRTGGRLPGNTDPVLIDTMDTTWAKVQAEMAEAANFALDTQSTANGFTRKNIGDPGTQQAVFNSIFSEDIEAQDKQFASRPLNLDLIHKEYPELAATPFGETVIAPIVQAAGRPVSMVELGRIAAESYAAGELTSDEATEGLVAYASSQFALYNALSGRSAIGVKLLAGEGASVIPLPSGRSDLGATVMQRVGTGLVLPLGQIIWALNPKLSGVKEEVVPVDITSPTDVNHFLNRYRSNAVARKLKEATTTGRATQE